MHFGFTAGHSWRVPWLLAAISMLAAFALAWAMAEATGHWASEVPAEMARLLHQHIGSIAH